MSQLQTLEHAKFAETDNGPAIKVVNSDGTAVASTVEMVGPFYTPAHLTSLTSQTLITGPGALHRININTPAANGIIAAFDGTDDSALNVLTITQPATLLDGAYSLLYNISLASGLHVRTTGAIQDVTFSYR